MRGKGYLADLENISAYAGRMRFFKRSLSLIFGILAVLIGSAIFAWLAYNLTVAVPEKEFVQSVGESFFYKAFRIISGLCMCFFMISIGFAWIKRSGFFSKAVHQKKSVE